MLATTDHSLPANDVVHLRTAFDMVGRHLFGCQWPKDMAAAVRLGQRSKFRKERACGQWTLKSLTQCVENGWLPVVYFMGEKRVRYFESADGLALSALYPYPTDDGEGQIELRGGDIYPCMVNVAGFRDVLRSKFALPGATKRGPRRKYPEYEQALDQFFAVSPLAAPYRAIIDELRQTLPPSQLPPRSTEYRLIDEAKARAASRHSIHH